MKLEQRTLRICTVILLCADGRREDSFGLTYGDTIEIFTNLGYEIRDLLKSK